MSLWRHYEPDHDEQRSTWWDGYRAGYDDGVADRQAREPEGRDEVLPAGPDYPIDPWAPR